MIDAPRSALIAGATGEVGRALLARLAAHPAYDRVIVAARRAGRDLPAKVEWRTVDFDDLEAALADARVDDVFCTLGTTMKRAGSKAAFRRVDHDYVLALARAGRAAGARRFLLNSSIGADATSSSFYLRVKGEVEAAVGELGYAVYGVARPSLLLSDRDESRPGEAVAVAVAPALNPALLGPLRKYRAIDVDTVAAALLGAALTAPEGRHDYAYDALVRLAGQA